MLPTTKLNFLSEADRRRANSTLHRLTQHKISRWVLTGGRGPKWLEVRDFPGVVANEFNATATHFAYTVDARISFPPISQIGMLTINPSSSGSARTQWQPAEGKDGMKLTAQQWFERGFASNDRKQQIALLPFRKARRLTFCAALRAAR
jgi:hypothetical protein